MSSVGGVCNDGNSSSVDESHSINDDEEWIHINQDTEALMSTELIPPSIMNMHFNSNNITISESTIVFVYILLVTI